jgi:inorganic pyrophosphatase
MHSARISAIQATPVGVQAEIEASAPEVEVLIEVPRGSHLKRDSSGRVSFVSPLPCPYNYGCVPTHVGLEGDLLDALVLGPRLALGTRIRLKAWGAITLTDRGLSDDKLVCSATSPTPAECERVLRFFRFYARCKGLINYVRARPGRNACDGWTTAAHALSRARPRDPSWTGPSIEF